LKEWDATKGQRDTCSLQIANFERVLRGHPENAFPDDRALLVAEKAVDVHWFARGQEVEMDERATEDSCCNDFLEIN
jgi:hypothetical protein